MTSPTRQMSRPSRSSLESCAGDQPLDARWEPWMDRLLEDPDRCEELLNQFGSPLHVHNTGPFLRNVAELDEAASASGVDLFIHFARKANKCVTYVESAADAGIGVDVASYEELRQTLASGVPPRDIIVTSAVKPSRLIELCVAQSVRVAIDNDDEAMHIIAECERQKKRINAAIRISFHSRSNSMPSRFGIPVEEALAAAERWSEGGYVIIDGFHFHLDGYSASDRVAALDATMKLADDLKDAEIAEIEFIDIGGGFPMRYLDHEDQWTTFWSSLEDALRETRQPVTYRNGGYGLGVHSGEIVGKRQAYPHAQQLVGGDWLRQICDASRPSDPLRTIAESLVSRGLRLHCEPGRSLLDGCGMTLARVEHRKRVGDDWLIALAMNSSNCRSQKSELFADPRLVRTGTKSNEIQPPMAGYLAGAYCAEGDLIMHRRLNFSSGVNVGDIVAIPNTAGYLMHFTESRSHQFPLPLNVDLTTGSPELDRIDEPPAILL